jgi:DNA invertase Pin-like site-specific DNA recombinase
MKVAKAKGRLRGTPPKLNCRQEAHLLSLHSGEYSTLEVDELFGVGRSTVYRAIERQRSKPEPASRTHHRGAYTTLTAPAVPNPTPCGTLAPRHCRRA